MEQPGRLNCFSPVEINGYMEKLKMEYDVVRLVDADECRVVEARPDGEIIYLHECFRIWGRGARCENCSSYRACHTKCMETKSEYLGADRENIRSLPVELIIADGETQPFVVECVRFAAKDEEGARAAGIPEHDERTTDLLTHLYNAETLYREIRRDLIEDPDKKRILLMCNIRNFTLFNQLFGAERANRLLIGVADFLRGAVPAGGAVGRYRDDRFLLYTPLEGFDVRAFADSFRECVRSLFDSPVFEMNVKIASYDITDMNMPIAVMTDHAEMALEAARDDYEEPLCVFTEDLLEHKLVEQRVLSHFESSMKNGEYKIYLQPQVGDGGRLTGAEALVRWIRPEGVVPPSEFIPVLAKSGLLSHLDLHVWEQAVATLGKWKGTELDGCTISINVDPYDFFYLNVPEELSRLCGRYGIDPSLLKVEITEKALFEDTEREVSVVDSLHDAGFTVSIDDFGKGYSSLSILKDVRVDTLKIDMGFIQGERNIDRSMIIIKSVNDMAENLGMKVIIEGVETEDQMKKLTRIGCRNFQGYFFSRPVPVCDFEAFAHSRMTK